MISEQIWSFDWMRNVELESWWHSIVYVSIFHQFFCNQYRLKPRIFSQPICILVFTRYKFCNFFTNETMYDLFCWIHIISSETNNTALLSLQTIVTHGTCFPYPGMNDPSSLIMKAYCSCFCIVMTLLHYITQQFTITITLSTNMNG